MKEVREGGPAAAAAVSRASCLCLGVDHGVYGICLFCGRIACRLENSRICLFCGNSVKLADDATAVAEKQPAAGSKTGREKGTRAQKEGEGTRREEKESFHAPGFLTAQQRRKVARQQRPTGRVPLLHAFPNTPAMKGVSAQRGKGERGGEGEEEESEEDGDERRIDDGWLEEERPGVTDPEKVRRARLQALEKALFLRDHLVFLGETSAIRSVVCDDSADWFQEISNKWISRERRAEAAALHAQHLHLQQQEKQKARITIDLASRTITDDSGLYAEQMDEVQQQQLRAFYMACAEGDANSTEEQLLLLQRAQQLLQEQQQKQQQLEAEDKEEAAAAAACGTDAAAGAYGSSREQQQQQDAAPGLALWGRNKDALCLGLQLKKKKKAAGFNREELYEGGAFPSLQPGNKKQEQRNSGNASSREGSLHLQEANNAARAAAAKEQEDEEEQQAEDAEEQQQLMRAKDSCLNPDLSVASQRLAALLQRRGQDVDEAEAQVTVASPLRSPAAAAAAVRERLEVEDAASSAAAAEEKDKHQPLGRWKQQLQERLEAAAALQQPTAARRAAAAEDNIIISLPSQSSSSRRRVVDWAGDTHAQGKRHLHALAATSAAAARGEVHEEPETTAGPEQHSSVGAKRKGNHVSRRKSYSDTGSSRRESSRSSRSRGSKSSRSHGSRSSSRNGSSKDSIEEDRVQSAAAAFDVSKQWAAAAAEGKAKATAKPKQQQRPRRFFVASPALLGREEAEASFAGEDSDEETHTVCLDTAAAGEKEALHMQIKRENDCSAATFASSTAAASEGNPPASTHSPGVARKAAAAGGGGLAAAAAATAAAATGPARGEGGGEEGLQQFGEGNPLAAAAAAAVQKGRPSVCAFSSWMEEEEVMRGNTAAAAAEEGDDRGVCITVRQPFASFIIEGFKTKEGRNWDCNYKGRLWIHAAAAVPDEGLIAAARLFHEQLLHTQRRGRATEESESANMALAADDAASSSAEQEAPPFPSTFPTSAVLGCVTCLGCRNKKQKQQQLPSPVHGQEKDMTPAELLPDETEGYTHELLLVKPRRLRVPVKMKGSQGMWQLPAEKLLHLQRALLPARWPRLLWHQHLAGQQLQHASTPSAAAGFSPAAVAAAAGCKPKENNRGKRKGGK